MSIKSKKPANSVSCLPFFSSSQHVQLLQPFDSVTETPDPTLKMTRKRGKEENKKGCLLYSWVLRCLKQNFSIYYRIQDEKCHLKHMEGPRLHNLAISYAVVWVVRKLLKRNNPWTSLAAFCRLLTKIHFLYLYIQFPSISAWRACTQRL